VCADEIEAPQLPELLAVENDQPDDARLLALQFQRGPRFGDAVHKILENATEGSVWPAQRDLLVRTLQANGAAAANADDTGALEAVGRLVDRVRNSDLGDGVRLGKLDAAARVAEFEFQFPLRRVGVRQLRSICSAEDMPDKDIPPLSTDRRTSFIRNPSTTLVGGSAPRSAGDNGDIRLFFT